VRHDLLYYTATHCNTLQHTATHCNTLQHTATRCSTLQHRSFFVHCDSLQHTAAHCNTLRHTTAHCNTLQHTATQEFLVQPSQLWHVFLLQFLIARVTQHMFQRVEYVFQHFAKQTTKQEPFCNLEKSE